MKNLGLDDFMLFFFSRSFCMKVNNILKKWNSTENIYLFISKFKNKNMTLTSIIMPFSFSVPSSVYEPDPPTN